MRYCLLFATVIASATIIDRIAIIVEKHAILDSSINRDIRVTSFLNHETPDFSPASRKKAASRLIDQELIRDQVRTGGYPIAPENETLQMLGEIKRDRFPNEAAYKRALSQTGITEDELKDRLSWQLTVLRFIDARFRPAVVVTDEEARRYYDQHRGEFNTSFEQARQKIVDQITGDRVNGLLDEWLKQARKEAHIEYLEKTLQ